MIREIVPGIFLGGRAEAHNPEILKKAGIKTIVNFDQQKDEPVMCLSLNYVHVPFNDAFDSNRPSQFQEALWAIQKAVRPCLIHCAMGKSRSPAILAYYLYKVFPPEFDFNRDYESLDAAFDFIVQKYPIADRGGIFLFIKRKILNQGR